MGATVGIICVESVGASVCVSVGAIVWVGNTVRGGTVGSNVEAGAASVGRGGGFGAPQPAIITAKTKNIAEWLWEEILVICSSPAIRWMKPSFWNLVPVRGLF
jgi:hypothetical protein